MIDVLELIERCRRRGRLIDKREKSDVQIPSIVLDVNPAMERGKITHTIRDGYCELCTVS